MKKKNILLIDDNDNFASALQKYLEEDGHTVSCYNKGSDAIKLSHGLTFDFILTDYRMPEMSGDGVCRLLRMQNPFAFIVGFSIENRKQDFLDAGADDFILKDELLNQLNVLLLKASNRPF
jgi:CheY-like chemotaxis protein